MADRHARHENICERQRQTLLRGHRGESSWRMIFCCERASAQAIQCAASDLMAIEHAPRRRFTGDEIERMAQIGILHEDDRVELIAGELREMSPIGDRHVACVVQLTDLCQAAYGAQARISVQNPVRLDAYDEPQPDLTLIRRTATYPAGKPLVQDLLLIIEVADTSLAYDRGEKLPLYAGAGLPEVWLVDLTHDVIYVYRKPDRVAGTYSVVSRRRRGGQVAPRFAPEHGLAVDEILGPARPK